MAGGNYNPVEALLLMLQLALGNMAPFVLILVPVLFFRMFLRGPQRPLRWDVFETLFYVGPGTFLVGLVLERLGRTEPRPAARTQLPPARDYAYTRYNREMRTIPPDPFAPKPQQSESPIAQHSPVVAPAND
jgi:hypothetical protein